MSVAFPVGIGMDAGCLALLGNYWSTRAGNAILPVWRRACLWCCDYSDAVAYRKLPGGGSAGVSKKGMVLFAGLRSDMDSLPVRGGGMYPTLRHKSGESLVLTRQLVFRFCRSAYS